VSPEGPRGTPPLVGRELDLVVAFQQLERIEKGTPAALLVRGDAGIGKSRLVAELTTRAEELGYPVVMGRADDLDHGIPFAVFRDVLTRLVPEGAVAGRTDALRAKIERSDDEAGDAEHLSAVFAATVGLIRAVGDGAPVVLVLEDLHAADGESLALAALLVRLADLPVLTVATLRPGGGATELDRLGERMAFDGRGAVVDLEPLDRRETQALAASVIGADLDDRLTGAVVEASRGNPFFVCEVAQSLVDGNAVVVDGDRAHLVAGAPAIGLRPSTALLRRLFVGTASDVELAKVMAVFGRFSLRHLGLAERLTGLSAEGVTRSFDRLVKAQLLAHAADGGYEFTHSIVRTTLYDDIGPAERRRIHAAIATELAAERRAGMVLDILDLATHVAASAEPGNAAAAEVLLEAGRTIGSTAPLVSADYHRRALGLLPVDSPRRPEAMALQARALHVGARPREAAAVGRDALRVLPSGAVRRGTVALVVNDLYLDGRPKDALEVIEAELSLGGTPCPLLGMRTNLLLQTGSYAAAVAVFPDAVGSLDGAEVTPAAELMALAHLVQYANHVGQVDRAADLLRRVEALSERASRTVSLSAHELVAYADWRPGLLARMEEHLRVAAAMRPEGAAVSIGGSSESARVRLLWMRGDWDEALTLIGSAGFDLEQRGAVSSAQLLACAACELYVDRGDLDAAAAALQVDDSILSVTRHATLARARVHHAVGEPDAALGLLERERVEASASGGSVWKQAEILRLAVDIHLDAGRVDDARDVASEIEALAARTAWLECRVPALRARALVDRDVEVARAYRDLAAAEAWEVERAHALLVLGELGDDPGRHLNEAYKAFDLFGAAPWRRRAAAGLRSRGLTVPRRVAHPASDLTDTEVQLVRLVRDGLSNRQIAAAMHYSRKTIEVYLPRVYAKTGCASRLELIRALDTGAVRLGEA
jgi:DNA-binding CsgD family transcriptional regulator